jgi:hypothetical protein
MSLKRIVVRIRGDTDPRISATRHTDFNISWLWEVWDRKLNERIAWGKSDSLDLAVRDCEIVRACHEKQRGESF